MDDTFEFNWKIENFQNCPIPTGQAILGPVFVADTPYRTHWRLKLYPNGLENPDFVSCFLECHPNNDRCLRRVSLLMTVVGVEDSHDVHHFLRDVQVLCGRDVGFRELVSWETLRSRPLLPLGSFSIRCFLRSVVPQDPSDEDLPKLSQNLRKLYLSTDFTNLVLKSDREEFPVHREIVCARAPVFSRKLNLLQPLQKNSSKMKHKVFVDIPVSTLKALLLYLYSGVIESPLVDVWSQLYDLGDRFDLFDMRRDIFPSPKKTSFRTRAECVSRSVVFAIEDFRSATLGRLVDLDFARVGVECHCVDEKLEFLLWCFVDDPEGATERLSCAVSVLDVDENPHYTSVHGVALDGAVTAFALPAAVARGSVRSDSFWSRGTLRVSFTFSVADGLEPTRIETLKTCRALCLGSEPPSYVALRRLSRDLEMLADGNTIVIADHDQMEHESKLAKAILGAWSPAYARLLYEAQMVQNSVCTPTADADTGRLVFRFLCTGRIYIPSFKTASDVYSVALMYRIDTLRRICTRNMASHLAEDNVIDALVFAYTYDEEELYASSQDFVCSHKDEILCTEKWKGMYKRYPHIVKKVMSQVINNNLEQAYALNLAMGEDSEELDLD